jgi:transposase
MAASLGDGKAFNSGRQVSAWLGIVPGQDSSGGKAKLLGISKRGDTCLRTLLIHGARSQVKAAAKKDDAQSRWINEPCLSGCCTMMRWIQLHPLRGCSPIP